MMLSRIAESLFWIGRYLERAEDTCRILDVHLQMLVEEPTTDEEESSHKLLRVMGAPAEGAIDTDAVMRILCYDPASPCSIVAAVGGVRESARRARETVSPRCGRPSTPRGTRCGAGVCSACVRRACSARSRSAPPSSPASPTPR